MTTVIILMYGAGAILVISALSTDPNTGQSPSIIATLLEIWFGKGEMKSTAPGEGPAGSQQSAAHNQPGMAGTATERTHAATYWLHQHGY